MPRRTTIGTMPVSHATANFHVSSSNQGGTIVTDPPVVAMTDPQPGALANPRVA
jgi:hypothetical protein